MEQNNSINMVIIRLSIDEKPSQVNGCRS